MKLNAKQIGAILIAALFGFSFIGYIGIGGSNHSGSNNYANSQTIEYNGYTFNLENNHWVTTIANRQMYFLSPPTALEAFNVPVDVKEILSNNKVYLAYDPTNAIDLAYVQPLAYNFFSGFGVQTFPACTKEELCPNIPIIDCKQDHAIIFLQDDNTTSITTRDNCVELRALNVDTIVRQLERTFYSTLGVME